ncbi:MAG: translation initiation factor IF-2 [Bacillota bacterium]|nr:translation initiation factor IF-2 [Bacillota bacterium]
MRRGPVVQPKVLIDGPMTVKELASRAGVPMAAAVKSLIGMGIMATVNQTLDVDIARRLAAELGATVEEPVKTGEEHPERLAVQEKTSKFLRGRAPVVTVMGHVDHGKTTLLDAIRKSNVAAHEAGGITQHIGASVVNWQGHRIVFIDTPGHEAFTAMRARGAQVTDLVVLVVAADDGVKPQTLEAISHIRAAGVPMIVAVNKIDRPGADPDRVKRQLSEQAVTAEDWGGDTVFVNVSALKGTGVDTLLEMIILISEMQDLKANPLRPARGTVVESKLDRGRGPVATVLIQTGTLRVGDAVYAGASVGRVRALFDHLGQRLDQAGPSMPVEVLGLSEVPIAGDPFEVAEDEKSAREKAVQAFSERRGDQAARPSVSLEDLYSKLKAGETKDLNLVVKADVQGSLEALRSTLGNLSLPEVRVSILHTGVGPITQDDVMLASASDAIVIGFGVRPDPNARRVAQRERVDIRTYQIIYEIVDDITAAAKGMLAPKMERVLAGKAHVRAVFQVPRQGSIAGCYVTEGKIVRNSEVKVVRDGKTLYEGRVDSLKRFKDDAREVAAGFECGVGVDGFNDFAEGDVIEAYIMQKVEREA